MVSGLTLKSLIHFKLLFVSGIKQGPIFIHFHVNIVFPTPFIEETKLFPLSIQLYFPLAKQQLTVYTWVCFWVPDSVPAVFLSAFLPVPCWFDHHSSGVQLGIRKCDSSIFTLPQVCFSYLRSFVTPWTCRIVFSISTKTAIGIVIGITLNLQTALNS